MRHPDRLDRNVATRFAAKLSPNFEDIDRVKDLCRVPSISVGVLHEGKVIFMESLALRDVEHKLEADCDTSYLLGSVSKMFASAALGILVDEGKISWHDTIQQHLPNFDPAGDPEV